MALVVVLMGMQDHAPTWRTRGYVPHLESFDVVQAITFRLADSLPRAILDELETELVSTPKEQQSSARRLLIEAHLDSGHGCCVLRHPMMAEVVENALLHFDGARYQLIAWCVMPNHVHVMIKPGDALGRIVRSWKSFTSRWAHCNSSELGWNPVGKSLWMREYWDRFMRDGDHYSNSVSYIHNNPVKANLCATPEDWQWSSARRWKSMD